MMAPGDGRPVRVQTGGEPIKPCRPVHVVLDILLARPDDFDGAIKMLSDLDGSNDAIDLQPPAKTAADQMIVDHDLIQRQAGGLCRCRLGSRDGLRADPDFASVLADMNRAVHRLHGCVRKERELVSRLQFGAGACQGFVAIADILRRV